MKHAILALAVLLGACGSDSTPPPPTTVARQNLITYSGEGFTIGYPSGWKIQPEAGIVSFTAPLAIGGFTDNFNVSYGEVPDSMRIAYYDGEVDRMRQFFGSIEIFEDVDVSIDGIPAKALTFSATQDQTVIGISRLVVQKDNIAYEITFFSTVQRMAELTPIVQDVLASFRFAA